MSAHLLSACLAVFILVGVTACGDPQAGSEFTFEPVAIVTTLPDDFPIEVFRNAPVYLDEYCGVTLANEIDALVVEGEAEGLVTWFESVGFEVLSSDPTDTPEGPAVSFVVRVPMGSPPAAVRATSTQDGVLVSSGRGVALARELGFACTPTASSGRGRPSTAQHRPAPSS